jgi:hypothetical protein
VQLHDTVKIRVMKADGTYSRPFPASGTESLNAQTWMMDHRGSWYDRTR